jgi:hypothetical protein
MGVRTTDAEHKVALFDSVTGWAFGPIFEDDEEANDFLSFSEEKESRDLRQLTEAELNDLYGRWVRDRLIAKHNAERQN